jgi:hypothetical protein
MTLLNGLTVVDLARVSTATTGTGTITLGAAVSGFLTFNGAGITSGSNVPYAITDNSGAASETGWGTVTNSAGTWTLTRNVLQSTNGGAPISLSGSAQVMVSPIASLFPNGPTLLNTTTLSSGAAYLSDTTSLVGAAYSSYTVRLFNVVPATNSVDICLQFYANGAWVTSGYQVALYTYVDSYGSAQRAATGIGSIVLSYTNRVGVAANWGGMNARLELWNPAADNMQITGESTYYDTTAVSQGVNFIGAALVVAYPITGIRVYAAASGGSSSGYNITGTMKIYGNP